jgi:hypothetical protein
MTMPSMRSISASIREREQPDSYRMPTIQSEVCSILHTSVRTG